MIFNQFLNMHILRVYTGVGTQGGNVDSWVTLYKLEWSEEGGSWKTYHEGDQEVL